MLFDSNIQVPWYVLYRNEMRAKEREREMFYCKQIIRMYNRQLLIEFVYWYICEYVAYAFLLLSFKTKNPNQMLDIAF